MSESLNFSLSDNYLYVFCNKPTYMHTGFKFKVFINHVFYYNRVNLKTMVSLATPTGETYTVQFCGRYSGV